MTSQEAQVPYTYGDPDELLTADERPMLEGFLDHYRDVMVAKVRGVSEEDARKRLVASLTTLGGLLRHVRRVEMSWFEHRLAQTPLEELPFLQWVFEDQERDFLVQPDDTVPMLIAEYEAQCQRSREIAARFSLDDVVPHPERGPLSLRWIYVHMIEETARHAGHADILREQIDGSVGQ